MKISDLPYLDTTSIYYSGSLGINLVGNGNDGSDYVTGQVSVSDLADTYIRDKVGYPDGYFSEESKILYKESSEDSEIWSTSVGSLTSTIVSCMLSENYLSEYLSEYLSTYMADYFDSLLPTSPDDISGVVTMSSDYSSLQYIQTSSLHDLICSCIYYDGAYSDTLSDDTYLAGIFDYNDDRRLAYITLGEIVSYIREHL